MNENTGATARQVLEQPFDQSLIKTRPGKHGETLSYVPTYQYVARLNAAYNGEWDFRITSSEVREDEIIVVARLTAAGVTKEDFGAATVTRRRETSEIIDIGDSYKSAASDALKRCCRLFGLGLTLYAEGDSVADSARGNGQAKPTNGDNAQPAAANGNGNGHEPSGNHNGALPNGNGSAAPVNGGNRNGDGSRITSRQLSAILAIGRSKGLSRDQIAAKINERFGRQVEFLSKSEASWAIEEMTAA